MTLLILGERVATEARARELEKTVKKAAADAQKATQQAEKLAERAVKTHEANIKRTEREGEQKLAASGRAHVKKQKSVFAFVVKNLGPRAASFDLLFCNELPTNRRPLRIA